jgi:hypothetical protein
LFVDRGTTIGGQSFDGLLEEVGTLWDDQARLVNYMVKNFPLARAGVVPQFLIEYEG